MSIEWKISPGLTPYPEALAVMEQRVADIAAGNASELVWLVEHPPLYTSGTSAKSSDLLEPERFPVYDVGRGGEYTYHGPGQRVAYVMLNLKARNAQDIKAYVANLEQWLINTLAQFGVTGERRQGRVGIWVKQGYGKEAKIGAIGVRLRKWVTFHGVALNVEPDLSHFSGIVPCGISQYGVTSLADLGHIVTMAEVDKVLKDEFEAIW